MKFEARILGALVDKYERSKTFSGENAVRQSFEVKIAKLLPRYADETDYDYFADVNASVAALKEKGFVDVARRGDVVKSVRLVPESLEFCYEFLKRRPKKSVQDDLRKMLVGYAEGNDFLRKFCPLQIERLAANKTVQGFDGDFGEFEDVLKVLAACFDVERETFRRDFSARALGDSKAFDKVRTKVESILWEHGDFADRATIFDDLNIVRNPGHVFFKGNARLKIGGQSLDLSMVAGDMALSSSALASLEEIDVRCGKVMTIENLTTFNAFNDPDVFAIYLGGFHNTLRRELIKKVWNGNRGKEYLHYGDIDAGGLHILQHLRRKTVIPFKPFRMDVETLAANRGKWKPLTENDRNRLRRFADTEFVDVAEYMLDNNCKLEQEQLD